MDFIFRSIQLLVVRSFLIRSINWHTIHMNQMIRTIRKIFTFNINFSFYSKTFSYIRESQIRFSFFFLVSGF